MLAALLALVSALLAFAVLMAAPLLSRGPWLIRAAPIIRPPLFVAAVALAAFALWSGATSCAAMAVLAVTGVVVLVALAGNPARAFPALDDPGVLAAADATLAPGAQVLALEVDGEARAWLLDTVAHHHLINDRLAGRAVLVSYCPLCRSGVAYDTTEGSSRLRFRVAGFWRRNMMMRDDRTGTIWQQSTGDGEVGPRRKTTLPMLLPELTTWGSWRTEHPSTTVVVEPPAPRLDYRRLLPIAALFERGPRLIARMPMAGPRDPRLAGIAEVAGVTIAGAVRAYPCGLLAERRLVVDEVGGRRVAILHDRESGRVRGFLLGDGVVQLALAPDGTLCGEPAGHWDGRGRPIGGDGDAPLEGLPVKRELWHSWSEFHPGADLYS
jgi:hypothetical protein